MKRLTLLVVFLAAAVVFAGMPRYGVGTDSHRAGTTSGGANRRDSTTINIGMCGEGDKIATATVYVGSGLDSATNIVFVKRGFSLSDTVIVRLGTTDAFGNDFVIFSSAVTAIPATVQLTSPAANGLVADTLFKTSAWIRIVTADTTSDSTITTGRVKYPVKYEFRLVK